MTATSVPVGLLRDEHVCSNLFARSVLGPGRATGRCSPRVLVTLLVIPLLLLALGCKPESQKVRFPRRVLVEDFQTSLDRDLSDLLLKVDRSKTGRFFGQHVMKALYDDVNVAELTLGAVELRPGQFPDRPELRPLVDECARILQMPKPRVFIVDSPGLGTSSVGFEQPAILLPSRTLKSFTDPAELRFIVGRELGHIRCGHAKWQPVLRWIVAELGGLKAIPERFAAVPLLPLLKWSREAEMSADNAGLICCQNPKAAERVLAALLLGARDPSIGEIDVDSLLKQRLGLAGSQFSELALLWREAVQQHPFVPDRIEQLRGYVESARYERIWD